MQNHSLHGSNSARFPVNHNREPVINVPFDFPVCPFDFPAQVSTGIVRIQIVSHLTVRLLTFIANVYYSMIKFENQDLIFILFQFLQKQKAAFAGCL